MSTAARPVKTTDRHLRESRSDQQHARTGFRCRPTDANPSGRRTRLPKWELSADPRTRRARAGEGGIAEDKIVRASAGPASSTSRTVNPANRRISSSC